MRTPAADQPPVSCPPGRWHRRVRRDCQALGGLLLAYTLTAYLLMPAWWRRHEAHALPPASPQTTRTAEGIPADPLNVAVVGTSDEVVRAMLAAGWGPADPITLRSSLRISRSVLLRRPYPEAPVSNLFLWGRRQDLAFQRAAGNNPRRRHHVRFWLSEDRDAGGRPVWVGAATFDRSVGLSHRTGQVTHHIARDVDEERDLLMADLGKTGSVTQTYDLPNQVPFRGRNGGGGCYLSDGRRVVAVLSDRGVAVATSEARE